MSSPVNITNITPPRVPFLDERTGFVSREWYRFLLNMFTITGNGTQQPTLGITTTAPLHTTGGQNPNLTITGSALSRSNDTNVTLTLSGSPNTALLASTTITAGWTGVLSTARGGTGPWPVAGGVLVGQGTSSAPAWSSTTTAFGYLTGAGGAVTQSTSRTTGVTSNTPTGAITLFSAAGSSTPTTFTVTNSKVAATDAVILSVKSGATNNYSFNVSAVAAGSFNITFWAQTGTAVDAPVVNFVVLKGAAS
jgi:hypothetical protein